MLSALANLLPRKIADLEAKLSGVNGFTGRGEVEYGGWKSGEKSLEVELRGVAGRTADVYVDNAFAVTVDLTDGRADKNFDTRRGDAFPDMIEGGRVEIRQNGDVILEGVLIPD